MIATSHTYALALDGRIIARGNKTQMHALRKRNPGSRVWLTSKPIGATV